jgi:hypothetical protein
VNNVVFLFGSARNVSNLSEQSITLMSLTRSVPAIKKLIGIHDILNINLDIYSKFVDSVSFKESFWDFASLYDMNTLRRELFIYHREDFVRPAVFDKFNHGTKTLLASIQKENESRNIGDLE